MDCQFISIYGKFVTSQTASFSDAVTTSHKRERRIPSGNSWMLLILNYSINLISQMTNYCKIKSFPKLSQILLTFQFVCTFILISMENNVIPLDNGSGSWKLLSVRFKWYYNSIFLNLRVQIKKLCHKSSKP